MSHEISPITTTAAPAAIGPYNQAVRAGDLLFCSGQIALDPDSGELVQGDVTVQVRRVLDNLKGVLEAARANLQAVVRTTIFLADMDDFARVNEVYAEYFASGVLPARSTVAVKTLPRNVAVEIDAIAWLGRDAE